MCFQVSLLLFLPSPLPLLLLYLPTPHSLRNCIHAAVSLGVVGSNLTLDKLLFSKDKIAVTPPSSEMNYYLILMCCIWLVLSGLRKILLGVGYPWTLSSHPLPSPCPSPSPPFPYSYNAGIGKGWPWLTAWVCAADGLRIGFTFLNSWGGKKVYFVTYEDYVTFKSVL